MDIFCARPSVLLVQTSWKHKRTWCFLFRMFQTRVAKNIFAQPCPLVNLAHLSAGLAPASWSMTHQNPAHVGLIPGVNICPKLGCVLLNGADFPSKWNRAHILITEPKLGTMCRTEPAQAWSSRVPTPCICSRYHVEISSAFFFFASTTSLVEDSPQIGESFWCSCNLSWYYFLFMENFSKPSLQSGSQSVDFTRIFHSSDIKKDNSSMGWKYFLRGNFKDALTWPASSPRAGWTSGLWLWRHPAGFRPRHKLGTNKWKHWKVQGVKVPLK